MNYFLRYHIYFLYEGMLCLLMPLLEMVVISVSVHEGPCECHEGLPECHQDGPHLLPSLLQCCQCLLPHTALQTGQPKLSQELICWVFCCCFFNQMGGDNLLQNIVYNVAYKLNLNRFVMIYNLYLTSGFLHY